MQGTATTTTTTSEQPGVATVVAAASASAPSSSSASASAHSNIAETSSANAHSAAPISTSDERLDRVASNKGLGAELPPGLAGVEPLEFAAGEKINPTSFDSRAVPALAFVAIEVTDFAKFPSRYDAFSRIDVVLTQEIKQPLPYHEYYTSERLKKDELTRSNQCIVVARVSSRSPEHILKAVGGFHPQITRPGVTPREGDKILDVANHREDSQISLPGSGLVSFSTEIDMLVRRYMPGQGDGYLYLVKATGAIAPSASDEHPEEFEYTMPGGVDAIDIIAYRKFNNHLPDGFIYVGSSFSRQYPQHVTAVMDALLRDGESYLSVLDSQTEMMRYANEIYDEAKKILDQYKPELVEYESLINLAFEKLRLAIDKKPLNVVNINSPCQEVAKFVLNLSDDLSIEVDAREIKKIKRLFYRFELHWNKCNEQDQNSGAKLAAAVASSMTKALGIGSSVSPAAAAAQSSSAPPPSAVAVVASAGLASAGADVITTIAATAPRPGRW